MTDVRGGRIRPLAVAYRSASSSSSVRPAGVVRRDCSSFCRSSSVFALDSGPPFGIEVHVVLAPPARDPSEDSHGLSGYSRRMLGVDSMMFPRPSAATK